MKKVFSLFAILSVFSLCLCSASEFDDEVIENEVYASKGGYAEVPAPKRPRPIDAEKAKAAAEKDESSDDEENFRNTIKYGIPSEISSLMDDLIKKEDPRFTDELYDVFQDTKNAVIKEKIITYFTKIEDPCLEDFAVDLMNDPYDEKNEVVKAAFNYIQACKTKEAIPAVITLIEGENESYFNDAIVTLGEIGGESEALFLAEYMDRDDLSVAQRQNLMRACGKMKALATWDKLVEILEDDDENVFVRMYAAEGLGLMKVEKSVPILVQNYKSNDPNLRQYIIKGLQNFPEVVEAKTTILQGIRDEHWKVRQESIRACKEMDIKDATPYLTYRIKNDSEKLIKEESIAALAALNDKKGNDFLVEQLSDKKVGDGTKKKIVECLLKEDHYGHKEIIQLATDCAGDDKRKDLRYAIGKELAKNYKSEYDSVCGLYLESKDPTTVSLGLDMYKNKKPASLTAKVQSIAEDKKANASNKKRAMKILGLEEEDLEKKDTSKTSDSNKNNYADAK